MIENEKKKSWKDCDHDVHYYYNELDGLIVGQVNKIAHTKIWLSKIIMKHNDEHYLGQFISYDFASKAVEKFWSIQDRTLIE